MARGTQLINLVSMLRAEVEKANSVAVGIEDLPNIKVKLRRTQELLYDEYDWPFLNQIFTEKTLYAGERYYDLPAGLNLERIKEDNGVVVWYGGLPHPIDRGIGFTEYTSYNSQKGVRVDPVLRWDVRWTGTKEQIEVWPMPASNTMTLQFEGIRQLRQLINDGDVADLDDQLIVLSVAAELTAKNNPEAASVLGKLAAIRKQRMQGRSAVGRNRYCVGQKTSDIRKPVIVVRASPPTS